MRRPARREELGTLGLVKKVCRAPAVCARGVRSRSGLLAVGTGAAQPLDLDNRAVGSEPVLVCDPGEQRLESPRLHLVDVSA